jgi:ATP-dependent DNA ligase
VTLSPPIEPMLAKLARELPLDAFLYEPKWDGFRCMAFVSSDGVDLRSRNQRPLARYFPEVVADLGLLGPCVLDGELIATRDGVPDFSALLTRLHPAKSRSEHLATATPATFVAFDVLAVGDDDLMDAEFSQRRARLEAVLAAHDHPHVSLSAITADAGVARAWLDQSPRAGIDGVVAKPVSLRYEPGRRAMIKVKLERTVDCVVAGMRAYDDGDAPAVASLLLGLFDDAGALRHVGVASSFRKPDRLALFRELAPLNVALSQHPWRDGFALEGGPTGRLRGAAGRWTPDMTMDWIPLEPVRVCEVGYDQRDGYRFRHPAQFKRWRPDRDAPSCTVEQLSP